MKLANEELIPVTPRGAGTGLSGGAVPLYRGIVLSLEKMNRILELDEKNLTITVEPGVVTGEIQKFANRHGLLYAGDPCSGDSSFIGGNVAENAGGNKVIKYGPTGSHVLGLEVVLPNGEVTFFGGKRVKDVTGYNFVQLMIGSEGTLGIVTKIVLRLLPLPKYVVDLLVPFKTMKEAIDFVPIIVREGKIVPTSIEFMDRPSLLLTEQFLNAKLPYDDAEAQLIIELEGNNKSAVEDDYERIGNLCFEHGALEVFVADNRNTRERIWRIRKSIAEAVNALYPANCLEDVVVPTSNIPELMREVDEISRKHNVKAISYGHAGDGNVHVTFLKDEKDSEEVWIKKLKAALEDLYSITKNLGGTISGEHGIGLKRRDYVELVLDKAQIELIKSVKRAFDPNLILNPGKIVRFE
jgi:glycolate oxidase